MRLYSFEPPHHGPASFHVVAADEQTARSLVQAYLKANTGGNPYRYPPDLANYDLVVTDPGAVMETDND